jgi:hypothetical protein
MICRPTSPGGTVQGHLVTDATTVFAAGEGPPYGPVTHVQFSVTIH